MYWIYKYREGHGGGETGSRDAGLGHGRERHPWGDVHGCTNVASSHGRLLASDRQLNKGLEEILSLFYFSYEKYTEISNRD